MNDENAIPENEPQAVEQTADHPVETPDAEAEAAENTGSDQAEPTEQADVDILPAEPLPEPEPEPAQTQLLRLRADFDNYRKRTEREKGEWTVRANERLIESLLPVLDTFDLGIADAIQQDAKPSVIEGFRMVQTMLLDTLQRSGLKTLDAMGIPFDPNLHEAINRMPSEEVEADHVLFQSRRGYLLGEKLLRPTQVVVSTGSAEVNENTSADDQ